MEVIIQRGMLDFVCRSPSKIAYLFYVHLVMLRKMRNFLWNGSLERKRSDLVNRKAVSLSFLNERFGIGNLRRGDEALMENWVWYC